MYTVHDQLNAVEFCECSSLIIVFFRDLNGLYDNIT